MKYLIYYFYGEEDRRIICVNQPDVNLVLYYENTDGCLKLLDFIYVGYENISGYRYVTFIENMELLEIINDRNLDEILKENDPELYKKYNNIENKKDYRARIAV